MGPVNLSQVNAKWTAEQALTGKLSAEPSVISIPRGLFHVRSTSAKWFKEGGKIVDANGKVICTAKENALIELMHLYDENGKPIVTVHAPDITRGTSSGDPTDFLIYTYKQNYKGQVHAKVNAKTHLYSAGDAKMYLFAKMQHHAGKGMYYAYNLITGEGATECLFYLVIDPREKFQYKMVTTLNKQTTQVLATAKQESQNTINVFCCFAGEFMELKTCAGVDTVGMVMTTIIADFFYTESCTGREKGPFRWLGGI